MLMQDSSIYKFQRTLFLKLGSYYPPLCPDRVGIQLTNSNTPIVTFRLFAFAIGVSQKNVGRGVDVCQR